MQARVTALVGVVAFLGIAAGAEARPASADRDGRPNILVVMTDDMAASDVALMPNVQRLLADKGTTFADAIDSFPLCCPARATFITGQYAHNHDVNGNFYPYGWYGMKNRGNTLPSWLQDAGYRTALIGKWLNGYGAVDAHGEVPKGFDIWRGLLDVSAYDYFNFVMNRDGQLRSWGDADFARKLVEFAKIEVIPNPTGLAAVFAKLTELFGPAPYDYWGTENEADYSPDVTGKITENLVRREARATQAILHLVDARGAAPRGRLDDADGAPRARPTARAPLRGAQQVATRSRAHRASTRMTSQTRPRTCRAPRGR